MIFIWNLQKNLQDKVNKNRMENCDYVHNCIQNNWLASRENNFDSLKPKKGKLLNQRNYFNNSLSMKKI